MKRYSKSFHSTLSEINITPLLDLAFVLLVIFVITTTPLVEDNVNLILPTASNRPKDPPRKPNYISVDTQGKVYLNARPIEITALYNEMVALRTADNDLNVVVRGDSGIPYQHVVNVIEVLQSANVIKVSLATLPSGPSVPSNNQGP